MKQLLPLILLLPIVTQAELSRLDDNELAAVDGEGINFVLEDFVYDASDASVTITDIAGTSQINVEALYIMGADSNKGSSKKSITLGRLENPFSLDIVDIEGAGNKGLSFKFPEYIADRGADIGITNKFTLDNGRTDIIQLSATDFSLDGSAIRLWGNGADTLGDLQLRIHADTLDIKNLTCPGATCNITNPGAETIHLSGVNADLRIGYGDIFPASFSVTTDGNFHLQATGLNASNYETYYATPKSNININNLTFGGTRSSTTAISGGVNIGAQTAQGIRLQYLDLRSHDI